MHGRFGGGGSAVDVAPMGKGARMSGGPRNGWREDWAGGETQFIQRIGCSSAYSAFESTSALNRTYSVPLRNME
jgi:hypothetical protein